MATPQHKRPSTSQAQVFQVNQAGEQLCGEDLSGEKPEAILFQAQTSSQDGDNCIKNHA